MHYGGTKVNWSNAGFGGKKSASGFNIGSKFLFKSTKHVYRPISMKNCATTSGTKNNPETSSREASCSNLFNAIRSVKNDEVLGANEGSSMRVETDVDEGQKADVAEGKKAHEQSTSNVVGMGDEDSDSEVKEVVNETTSFMASKSGGGDGKKSLYDR
ncbi:hypothetical protein Tco_1479187 [Tanacetum coccineum]